MVQFSNPMEIFKLLDRSNCRQCNQPTCLAFAVAVFQGKKQLAECPHLGRDLIDRHSNTAPRPMPREQARDESIQRLKNKIAAIDLGSAARLQTPTGTFLKI